MPVEERETAAQECAVCGAEGRQIKTAVARIGLHERARLRAELTQIPGLFVLLMKPRNGAPWTEDERMLLRARLHGLSHLSLYLALLALPGTALILPLLAWWLDRRKRRREAPKTSEH